MSNKKTYSSQLIDEMPEEKKTILGLYVTAQEAYEMWKEDQKNIKVIDVRTPEEYAFIGNPDQAWNIPLAFVTYHRENGITKYGPKMNSAFVADNEKDRWGGGYITAYVPFWWTFSYGH